MTHQHITSLSSELPALPVVRRIGVSDLRDALMAGLDDFRAMPTHVIFLGIIYPVVGLILTRITMGEALLPLLYPLIAGFALVGPFAAIGLYELSRRREMGLEASWSHAFDVLRSPSLGSIAVLGLLQMLIFVVWLAAAHALYIGLFGDVTPATIAGLLSQVFTTATG